MKNNSEISSKPAQTGTLGTFSGVFTPSILTILGIILFLRLDYVVGSAGFGRALIIIGLANVISVLTSISLSAIATNLTVKGGGDYYLISRTLGLEFGGAIGLVLFLAQSVSIAFYCIGFGEAITGMLKPTQMSWLTPQVIAFCAVSFLFVFAWMGADWATRFQYLVMSLLAAALLSFFVGGIPQWSSDILWKNWTVPNTSPDFWLVFAIFFPAVTGFTQGVSMSGDLKNPGKSLPLGTFWSVGVSIIVYFGVAVVFAGTLPNEVLTRDANAMKQLAWYKPLISAGVIAATLSSAMASFLGAPRILQSLAADRIFHYLNFFAKGSGATGNPRRGILLASGIACLTILLGSLNLIASVVTMFFLISYGLLNYATYYEARAASPSFRPRFKWFDLRLSLLGFLACLFAMLAIDLRTGIIATSILFAIYQYLKRTAGPARWSDSRRAHYLQRIRENILAVSAEPEHPRDWRPHILAFSNDPDRRQRLVRFASWLEGRSGMTTVVRIIEATGTKIHRDRLEHETDLRKAIQESGLTAFPLVVTVPEFQAGIQSLLQVYGIGPLKANTILMNWLHSDATFSYRFKEILFGQHLRSVYRLGYNIVILHTDSKRWEMTLSKPAENQRIDIWWRGDATSRLMLLLAYLMTRNAPWESASIRVVAVNYDVESEENTKHLTSTLNDVRIDAEPKIVLTADIETIGATSADASLVMLPIRLWKNRPVGPVDGQIDDLLKRLPTAALIMAAEDIELDAEPDDGIAAELAAARDAMEKAEKKHNDAEKEAAKARQTVNTAKENLEAFIENTAATQNKEELSRLEAELQRAELEAEKAFRRSAKAKAKALDAEKHAQTLGLITELPKDMAPADD